MLIIPTLRIPRNSYDPDIVAWINSRASVSDPVPTAYAVAVNQYVLDLKALSGVWDKITQLVVTAGASTIAGAIRSIKGNNLTNTNFINTDLDIKNGIRGDSATKSLSTGYSGNFVGSGQNDIHAFMQVTEAPTFGGRSIFGQGATSISRFAINWNQDTNCRAAPNSVSFSAIGGYGINRVNATEYQRMLANTTSTVTQNSAATNSGTYLVLARGSNGGSIPGNWSNARFNVWILGGGIPTLAAYTAPTNALLAALAAI